MCHNSGFYSCLDCIAVVVSVVTLLHGYTTVRGAWLGAATTMLILELGLGLGVWLHLRRPPVNAPRRR